VHTIALPAFVDEPQALVEFDCTDIVGADLEFYPDNAILTCMGKCCYQELLADAASPVTGENTHAKGATVFERLCLVGENIAPTYDGGAVNGDVLRGVVLDAFPNKTFDSVQRWCFRPREKFLLSRYCVETGSEAFSAGFSDAYNFD
jgi:hypothetical protein